MESLIYDRTLSDITNLTSKGYYNASDLNRVESWTKYLNDKFNELGYQTNAIKSTVKGALPLQMSDSANTTINNYKIYGNTDGVGDLVSDGDYAGKYKIPIKIGGKNVCKESEFDGMWPNGGYNNYDATNHIITFTSDVTGWSYGRYKFISNLTPKTKYTVSFYIRGTEGKKVACGWDGSRTNITLTSEYKRYSATTTSSSTSLGIVFYTWAYSSGGLGNGEYMQFKDVQVEVGDTMTDFTPYTDESNEYSIYLDEPLQANEYIDFETQNVYMPPLTTIKGGSTMYVNTAVSPSKAEVTYTMNKDGYKEKPIKVDYIESTGTQYIDTGILASEVDVIKLKGAFTQVSSAYACIIGSGTSASSSINAKAIRNKTDGVRITYGTLTETATSFLEENVIYQIEADLGSDVQTLKVDNETIITMNSKDEIDNPYNLTIFANNLAGVIYNYASFKLCDLQMYNDGILIRDYIPAIDSNGVVCLYDKVSNTYFYNKGTGNFIAGTSGGGEYLESTGTQYIDTEIVAESGVEIEIDYMITKDNNADNIIVGARSDGNRLWYDVDLTSNGDNLIVGYGDYYRAVTGANNVGNRRKAKIGLFANNQYLYLNGERVYENNIANSYSLTQNFYLFGANDSGTFKFGANAKIFNCKLKKNNTLLRDYIPAKDSNGVVAPYDKVSQRYFYNQGTGEFIYGERWQTKDDFVIEEANRIINNINVLRSIIALYSDTPATPETMRFLDYIKANNIEKILFDIDKLVNNMVANFRYSNDLISGEGYYS